MHQSCDNGRQFVYVNLPLTVQMFIWLDQLVIFTDLPSAPISSEQLQYIRPSSELQSRSAGFRYFKTRQSTFFFFFPDRKRNCKDKESRSKKMGSFSPTNKSLRSWLLSCCNFEVNSHSCKQ